MYRRDCRSTVSAPRRRGAFGRASLCVLLVLAGALAGCGSGTGSGGGDAAPAAAAQPSPEVFRDAYVYGYPMVDNYRVMHSYFADPGNPEYKGPWNQVHNIARVYTPEDKAIQTPNSDTPYSFLGADLRREPLVISVPEVAGGRYYSLQFIDLYTHNFAYVGSRATGNGAGSYLLAGPGWDGEAPEGIRSVLRSETDLALVLYRTQLFSNDDLPEVEKIQAGFTVQPLSAFTGTAPPEALGTEFMRPLGVDAQKSSAEFFDVLAYLFQFAPVHPGEVDVRSRFEEAGISPGRPFASALDAQGREAVEAGIADAWDDFNAYKAEMVDTGKRSAADGFGTREFLGNDYMARMSSAVLGIYGNSKEEALYPAYFVDADGAPMDGSRNRYAVRFGPDGLPPVNAFWSLTMYELPASLLTANPIDRYLINSTMLADLVRDPDGGITIHVQKESPGAAREANWLPAPDGPFFMILRAYWPDGDMLDGTWKQPAAVRVEE